jgi:predicted RNA-binding protein with PIN domain
VEPAAADDGPPSLPPEVRERVVALAAEALSGLAPEAVPAPLKAVARFTPAKRARLAAGGLAAALETDVAFRQAVADVARARQPGLAEAVAEGVPLPAAPVEDVAALAYLLRPAGWQGRLAAAGEDLAARAATKAGVASSEHVERLTAQLGELRAEVQAAAARADDDVAAARTQTEAARAEVAALRRRVRELGDRAATAERALQQVETPAVPPAPDDAELRRLRNRVAELEGAVAASRTAARDDRHAANVRLRVLVDTLVRAAVGLQRELALPPLDERPADLVEAEAGTPGHAHQGRDADDPTLLDELVTAPLVHLLVDGYNVTKSGYGDQTLEVQRNRLVGALGALVARTGAEVTVVFDGQDRTAPVAPPSPRGVRVRFSRSGETADDVLRALVRAEPLGRPLVVVTSDRAVADDVRADGARTAPSTALLRLLTR